MDYVLTRWCVLPLALAACATVVADDGHVEQASTSQVIGIEPLNFEFKPTSLGALQEAESQPEAAPELEKKHDWRAAVTMWLWLAGMDGQIGARGLVADANATFIDIVQNTDSILAFSGRLEVGCEKWGGYVDGTWMKLGVDDASGPLGMASIDIVQKMGILDFGLMYRLGDWPDQGPDQPHTTLDVYAGGRWWSMSLELNPANFPSREQDKNWIDPLIGAKLDVPIGEHWDLSIWGDVGGFGVSSDFTWSATGVIGYRFELFHIQSTAYFGYRAIGDDYTSGSGNDEFVWDIILHGPILGFTMSF